MMGENKESLRVCSNMNCLTLSNRMKDWEDHFLNNGLDPNSTSPTRGGKVQRGKKGGFICHCETAISWVGHNVIGWEIDDSPARHSDTVQGVMTFRTGHKVTQTFAQLPLSEDLGVYWAKYIRRNLVAGKERPLPPKPSPCCYFHKLSNVHANQDANTVCLCANTAWAFGSISALSGEFRREAQGPAVGASSEWTVVLGAAAAEGNNKADRREQSQRCRRYGKTSDCIGPQNAREQPKLSNQCNQGALVSEHQWKKQKVVSPELVTMYIYNFGFQVTRVIHIYFPSF